MKHFKGRKYLKNANWRWIYWLVIGRLHEEYSCMSDFILIWCSEKAACWVYSVAQGCCVVISQTCATLVTWFFRCLPAPFPPFLLLWAWKTYCVCLHQNTNHCTRTSAPLLTTTSTTCLHSLVSLGSHFSPSAFPPPVHHALSCPPFPWPTEGPMRKMERMSRAPRGEAYTITCTAFTCPVSTAVAPATVAKLACLRQPTLSAMPPSLNTCELAPPLAKG